MAYLNLTINDFHKAEMEYHGKFGNTIVQIQNIALMSIIDIYYTACSLETQTMAPTFTGFQGIKLCIKYMSSHPTKKSFILLILMMD